MKKLLLFIFIGLLGLVARGQTGTEFWFAAPEVTSGHGDDPIFIRVSTGVLPATVTISMPANGAFVPIVIPLAANTSFSQDMTAFKAMVETQPENTILNTGILISSTASISAYYEVSRTNNPDIFALKGASALGMEFYTPFQTLFYNTNYTPAPYASFDIVATEDNTLVRIYPRKDLVGHPAFAQFTVTLQRGETYSSRSVGTLGADKPAGSVIVSDKPIAVTIKDDSNGKNSGGGCRDLLGDQIVPVGIVGKEYIVTQGGLTTEESFFILATENNTSISIDGVYNETLFAGETSVHYVVQPHTFIQASKPVYLIHISGFGCEMGMALLPPLNCAGSEQVFFTRSTTEFFGLNLLVKTGSEDAFLLNGSTTLIQATDFVDVPGTGGKWKAAQLSFNDTEIPLNASNLITNTKDVFGMGIIHGGATSGCRFGYFSEFKAPIEVSAGADLLVCDGNKIQLTGDVSGGVNTGIWKTNGSGTFDLDTDFNTIYNPTASDYAIGNLQFRLTSTGICPAKTDTMDMNFTVAPTTDAGTNQVVCVNNSEVSLAGSVLIAPGAYWKGGAGTYIPDTTSLTATYQPTSVELLSGSMYMYLTSLPHADCAAAKDSILIDFTAAPIVSAGVDATVCENNPNVNLTGSVTSSAGAAGGTWGNGTGFVNPSNTALTGVYTPTPTEITNGVVNLVLRSDEGDNCALVYDTTRITIVPSPTANAGDDQVICVNNTTVTLNGSVTQATGGTWIGGLGTFSPDRNSLTATYTPAPSEIAFGSLILRLRTSGNAANCVFVEDDMTITFTAAPTLDAGVDQTICANNSLVSLSGTVLTAPGGTWSGGLGVFLPSNIALNATYQPTAGEITSGSMYVYLTSLTYQNCIEVKDSILLSFTAAPIVSAGSDITVCANNSDANLSGSVVSSFGGGSGTWSNGSGFVTPSNNALTGIYSPTTTEITNGIINLVLSSNDGDNCNYERDTVRITVLPTPVADANSDQVICANNAVVNLNGSVTQATGGSWIGGLGTFTPNRTDLNAVYTPNPSEISLGSVSLKLQTTGIAASCLVEEDDMLITFTPGPILDAGPNVSVCANNENVVLNASLSLASGATWSNYGGTFVTGDNQTLNATYRPSSLEKMNGKAVLYLTSLPYLNCSDVSDSIVITITPAPIVEAGPNKTSCANNTSVQLNGSFANASGVSWSGGAGSYIPSLNSPTTSYIPSAGEVTAGGVTLYLTTFDAVNNCIAERDSMKINISQSPTVNAGLDKISCANNATVQLNGSVTLAAGGRWSGGLGTFAPHDSASNATYTPTLTEVNSGNLLMTFTTIGNGTCNAVSDNMNLTFTIAPTVDAGVDQNICKNNAETQLDGGISVATGSVWLGGNGSYSPNAFDSKAKYTPTQAELNAGSLTLTLQTTGNGSCLQETDAVIITFTPEPFVAAGQDQFVCVTNLTASLNGFISGATTTGTWSTPNGTGIFFPNQNTLNATYVISSQDSINGNVDLILTSTNFGNCVAVVDSIKVRVTTPGTANAGLDQTVCSNNANVTLSGSVSGGASMGTWNSSGTGTFSPNNTDLSAVYIPSSLDATNKVIVLSLVANSCDLASDNMVVTITDGPQVDAGVDQLKCLNSPNVALSGIVSGASNTGQWASTGTGTFSPDNTTLNATYIPSGSDLSNKNFLLSLSATNIGSCKNIKDTIAITISELGTVNVGANQSVCGNNPNIAISAQLTGGATTGIWVSTGSGTFSPSPNVKDITYLPSIGDVSAGSAELKFISNSCDLASDSLVISYTSPPSVNAGNNQSVCANNSEVPLLGNFTLATGAIWSTIGTGSFTPSATAMNAIYTPSQSDIASGSLYIRLTTTGNANCQAEVDSIRINITPSALVDAGKDQSICFTNLNASLNAMITGASSTGKWATLGTGSFAPHDSLLTANYLLSSADSVNGAVTLVLTSTNNGGCISVKDSIVITVGGKAFVDAGIDNLICKEAPNAKLSGKVAGGASNGKWTSSGDGLFIPNDSTLTATYSFGTTDSQLESVDLYLTSIAEAGCQSSVDTVKIAVAPVTVVDVGSNQIICEDLDSVILNANIINGVSGKWKSTGNGFFSPNDSVFSPVYKFGPQDNLNKSVNLIFASTGNYGCEEKSDTITITLTNPVIADFEYNGKCTDQNIVFDDTSTTSFGDINSWAWDFGNGDNSGSQNPKTTYITAGNYDVTLVVGSTTGCSNSVTKSVAISNLPTADFALLTTTPKTYEPIEFTDQSIDASLWRWTFGTGDTLFLQDPVYTYKVAGTYSVQLYIENPFGCVDSTSLITSVIGEEVLPPKVPTAFTPNDDGTNDVYYVRGGPFREMDFRIYNQWGEVVYETQNPEEGWDGTYKGKKQPLGVYLFTIKAVTVDGGEYQKSGEVNLIE